MKNIGSIWRPKGEKWVKAKALPNAHQAEKSAPWAKCPAILVTEKLLKKTVENNKNMQKNKRKYIKIISAEKYENQVIAIHIAKVAVAIAENMKQGLRLEILSESLATQHRNNRRKKEARIETKTKKQLIQQALKSNNRRKHEARIET